MLPINLRSFRRKVEQKKKGMRAFLTRLEKDLPKDIDETTQLIDKDIWLETDCLTCGNCCKTMTPTFTREDIRRISSHFKMTPGQFKAKWLTYNKKDKDWVNVVMPCQFLDKKTNMCSIYSIRPADCAGFPHLAKKKIVNYMHVHKQNLSYCPATFKMVEKMQALIKG